MRMSAGALKSCPARTLLTRLMSGDSASALCASRLFRQLITRALMNSGTGMKFTLKSCSMTSTSLSDFTLRMNSSCFTGIHDPPPVEMLAKLAMAEEQPERDYDPTVLEESPGMRRSALERFLPEASSLASHHTGASRRPPTARACSATRADFCTPVFCRSRR